ncbi:hypothetical protein P3T76_004717 [Phytophthora citrophthora]|uniref:RxLR effector protein n=1 Tax=Phytophthora citrophthora TaxID=4793 RepID=A0AAD9GSE1_9STRA|nr:hypothetical protein P3T76_004717 [Phytophthora citrophthora]
MHYCHVLLLTTLMLLVSADSTASTALRLNSSDRRALRVTNENHIEERAGLGSKLTDLITKFSSKERQAVRFADAQKTDEFVLEAFKLKGLTGVRLKLDKNYKYFEQFQKVKESNQITAWIKAETPTSAVWRTSGFGNVRTIDDILAVEPTEAFQLYTRFLIQYDDAMTAKALRTNTPIPVISDDLTWAEKTVSVATWVGADRSRAFAKAALGLDNLTPAEMVKAKNFEFYYSFLHLRMKKFDRQGLITDEVL